MQAAKEYTHGAYSGAAEYTSGAAKDIMSARERTLSAATGAFVTSVSRFRLGSRSARFGHNPFGFWGEG